MENQPSRPSIRAFSIGPMTVLTRVWPVLKSLPHIGTPLSAASLSRAGMFRREVWSAVHEGHAFHQGRVGVDHRRGDEFIVVIKPTDEAFDVLMDLRLRNEFFGGAAPDHDQSVTTVVLLELPDVLPDGIDGSELGIRLLYVHSFDAFHVLVVEHRGHRFDRLKVVGNRLLSVRNGRVHRT